MVVFSVFQYSKCYAVAHDCSFLTFGFSINLVSQRIQMELEDDTTVLTTLKSFNSFISRSEPLSEQAGGIVSLQSHYKRSMEVNTSWLSQNSFIFLRGNLV